MERLGDILTFGAAAWLLAGSTAVADVRVTIHDGLVSVAATDATVREILAEWARVGQTKVVNLERIPGGPISIELTEVSEQQALEVLLRSVSGYVAALRPISVSNLSRFDRVIVMPTSVAPQPSVAAGPPPAFQQPQFGQAIAAGEEPDDQRSSPNAAMPPPGRRRGVFIANPPDGAAAPFGGAAQIPPPQVPQQPAPQPTKYSSAPNAPFGGVPIPGMVVPAPQPPEPSPPASGTSGAPKVRPRAR